MELRDYLFNSLSGYASFLNISSGSHEWFDSVIEEINTELGVNCTDTKALFSLGKFKLFQKLMVELSSNYSFSTEGESFSRIQMYDSVSKLVAQYFIEAFPYISSGYVEAVNF